MKRWTILIGLTLVATPSFGAALPASTDKCIDVRIGNDRAAALDCLNQTFQGNVAREHAVPKPEAPIDTHSSPAELGLATETAARQRMGNAFGASPVPQRPVRVFVPPLPIPTGR